MEAVSTIFFTFSELSNRNTWMSSGCDVIAYAHSSMTIGSLALLAVTSHGFVVSFFFRPSYKLANDCTIGSYLQSK